MIVEYLDNDGSELFFEEVREDVTSLLAILKLNGKINLRWPNEDSFIYAKFDEAVLDIEIVEVKRIETLKLFFDRIHSK